MTREEAISVLKLIHTEENGIVREPLNMAIKALEQKSCEDAISRQAVMNALCDKCELFKNGEQTCFTRCEEYHFLATLSPVTPQPKTGHWIMKGRMQNIKTCSICGNIISHIERDNYCPNCGAKMAESEG